MFWWMPFIPLFDPFSIASDQRQHDKKPNPTKATTAIGRSQSPSQRASAKPPAKAARKQLAGKAPLGSLPAEKEQSADRCA